RPAGFFQDGIVRRDCLDPGWFASRFLENRAASSSASMPEPSAPPPPPLREPDCDAGDMPVTVTVVVATSLLAVGSNWLLETVASRTALPGLLAVNVTVPVALAPAASDESEQVMLPVPM